MDSLLISFIAAALAQWGDRTQWLVADLAARYRRPGPVLAGSAFAILANAAIAGFGGRLVHGTVSPRAIALLVALALAFAAIDGLIGRKPKPIATGWRTGPILTAATCVFLIGFGNSSQFITAALSANYDAPWLTAAGAAAGTFASSLPAAALGERFARTAPVKAIRICVGLAFLVTAFIIAVNALQLT